MVEDGLLEKTVKLVKNSNKTTAFTGAGISAESGIPTFRGKGGFWEKYNPRSLSIDYFHQNPAESWKVLKEMYEVIIDSKPNRAHKVLAQMEKEGYLEGIITQNIDRLHHRAGNENIHEFHGGAGKLNCLNCGFSLEIKLNKKAPDKIDLEKPLCSKCNSILKPDVVFFGENIPQPEGELSFQMAKKSDLMLIIGTSGKVGPANLIPRKASSAGADIVEINKEHSNYTNTVADISLIGHATEILEKIYSEL